MLAAHRVLPQFKSSVVSFDAAVLALAPTAYWKLNESSGTSAADATGNGNPGTYMGGYTLGASGPLADGETAVSLNGTSGYVSLSSGASGSAYDITSSSGFTIAAWINPNSGTIAAASAGIMTATNGPIMRTSSGSLQSTIYGSSGSLTAGSLSAASWQFVAATVTKAGNIQNYLNGVSQGTSAIGSPWGTYGLTVIGNDAWASEFFGGSIAKVAWWQNTVLSGGQIAALYAAA